jgi:hypothetical protein
LNVTRKFLPVRSVAEKMALVFSTSVVMGFSLITSQPSSIARTM